MNVRKIVNGVNEVMDIDLIVFREDICIPDFKKACLVRSIFIGGILISFFRIIYNMWNENNIVKCVFFFR